MSEADAATSVNVAEKLGFKDGDLIQEFGYDDDVDFDLRDDIEDLTGSELLDEDDHEVVDAAILWWRSGDGERDGLYQRLDLERTRFLDYKIVGVGDFNRDGKPTSCGGARLKGLSASGSWMASIMSAELTWNRLETSTGRLQESPISIAMGIRISCGATTATGECRLGLMNATNLTEYRSLDTVADLNNMIVAVGDYNGNGQLEIFWRKARRKQKSAVAYERIRQGGGRRSGRDQRSL